MPHDPARRDRHAAKIAALALIVIGVVGLAYGRFTFTNGRQEIRVASVSMSMDQHRTVPIPLWAGLAAGGLGSGVLLMPARKSWARSGASWSSLSARSRIARHVSRRLSQARVLVSDN